MKRFVTFWEQRASEKMPKAYAARRVTGVGPFALLSCLDGVSRHVRLYLDETDRNRQLWKWDRNRTCGVAGCTEDHRMLDIGSSNETTTTTTEESAVYATR